MLVLVLVEVVAVGRMRCGLGSDYGTRRIQFPLPVSESTAIVGQQWCKVVFCGFSVELRRSKHQEVAAVPRSEAADVVQIQRKASKKRLCCQQQSKNSRQA